MAQELLLAQETSVSQFLGKHRSRIIQIREQHNDRPNINTLSNNNNNYWHKNYLFLKFYVHMENSLHRSGSNILMELMEDVPWVSSCHTMVGMVSVVLMQKEDYMLH